VGKDKPVYKCCKCGAKSERYMRSLGKERWNHYCLACEPYVKKESEGEQ
jgi:hypothetical protein